MLNTFSKGLARCSGSNWVFFPDPNWLCAPGANIMNIDIGSKIKTLRLSKSMTQEQLAKALHVSAQAVSKWENGVSHS